MFGSLAPKLLIGFLIQVMLSLEAFSQSSHVSLTPTIIHTSSGVRYGILGESGMDPAPTLFVFSGSLEDSLTHPIYSQCCSILRKKGFVCVSLDLPCHGQDVRTGDPEGLKGWSHRIRQGEDIMVDLVSRSSAVLDDLISRGVSTPDCILASGTSRGGFSAIHFAIGDDRVHSVAALSPVTDPRVLQEFSDLQENGLAQSLSLVEQVRKLAGKNLWLVIGNQDERVSTRKAVELALEVSLAASRNRIRSGVELHVEPAEGHRVPAGAYQRAAEWLLIQSCVANVFSGKFRVN